MNIEINEAKDGDKGGTEKKKKKTMLTIINLLDKALILLSLPPRLNLLHSNKKKNLNFFSRENRNDFKMNYEMKKTKRIPIN